MKGENIKNAQRMIKDLKKKKHPEYGPTKIKGCELSRSDVDMAIMIGESIIRNEGNYPSDFMPVYGEIRQLFAYYALPTEPSYFW